MKAKLHHLFTVLALLALFTLNLQLSTAHAQGTTFTYQGRVTDNATNFNGTGQFEFALVTSTNGQQATATANMGGVSPDEFVSSITVNPHGSGYTAAPTVTISGGGGSGATAQANLSGGEVASITVLTPGTGYSTAPTVSVAPPASDYTSWWSNDGTSVNGSEPGSAVSLGVSQGLFTMILGSTALANMTAIPASVFNIQTNLQLMIWFNDGVNGFALLNPPQSLTPVPQATFANSASNLLGAVLSTQLSGPVPSADLTSVPAASLTGTVLNSQLANSSITVTAGTGLSGGGAVALGNSTTLNNAGVTSLAGGDGVTVSASSGSVTLGLGSTLSLPAAPVTINSGGNLLLRADSSSNFFAGPLAGNTTTTGAFNAASGERALAANTSGSDNTANGYQALNNNTSGSQNVAVGSQALLNSTNDNQLVAIGYQALQNDNATNQGYTTSGNGENMAIGYRALQMDTTAPGNTALGYQALAKNTNIFNTAIGDDALQDNTSGWQNIAIGADALQVNISGLQNEAIGVVALGLNTSGSYNTAVGYNALGQQTNGDYNTAVGDNVLESLIIGDDNTAIGWVDHDSDQLPAGFNLNVGSNNIYIGNIGSNSESGIIRIGTTGTQTFTYLAGNVALDNTLNVDRYGQNNGNVYSNAIVFGAGAPFSGEGIASKRTGTNPDDLEFYTDYSNRMTILNGGDVGIGTNAPVYPLEMGSGAYCSAAGNWTSVSDRNAKEDFAAISPREVLEKVSALPITEWKYKIEAHGTEHIGPMAQDFYAAFGLNGTDDKHISTVDEGGVALAAIQGLNQKVEDQLKEKDGEIQTLKQQNDSLAERLNELEATVKQLAAQK